MSATYDQTQRAAEIRSYSRDIDYVRTLASKTDHAELDAMDEIMAGGTGEPTEADRTKVLLERAADFLGRNATYKKVVELAEIFDEIEKKSERRWAYEVDRLKKVAMDSIHTHVVAANVDSRCRSCRQFHASVACPEDGSFEERLVSGRCPACEGFHGAGRCTV